MLAVLLLRFLALVSIAKVDDDLFNRSGDTAGIVYNLANPFICGRRVIGVSCIFVMRSRQFCNLSPSCRLGT
jgi:hypothetical protein